MDKLEHPALFTEVKKNIDKAEYQNTLEEDHFKPSEKKQMNLHANKFYSTVNYSPQNHVVLLPGCF